MVVVYSLWFSYEYQRGVKSFPQRLGKVSFFLLNLSQISDTYCTYYINNTYIIYVMYMFLGGLFLYVKLVITVRKFIWWRYCIALFDKIFEHLPLFDKTFCHIVLCNSVIIHIQRNPSKLQSSWNPLTFSPLDSVPNCVWGKKSHFFPSHCIDWSPYTDRTWGFDRWIVYLLGTGPHLLYWSWPVSNWDN